MDLRIVHPVPLAMHDVVAEFHVLDDLGHREHRGSRKPEPAMATAQQCQSTAGLQNALCRNRSTQIPCVAHTAIRFDLASQRIEFGAECFDVGFGQVCVLIDVSDCHCACSLLAGVVPGACGAPARVRPARRGPGRDVLIHCPRVPVYWRTGDIDHAARTPSACARRSLVTGDRLRRRFLIALRRPLRRPVAGSMAATKRCSGSLLKRRSDAVSGASSAVAFRYLSGSDNLAIVRHDFQYCTRNGPVVYGRSYFSHSARTLTADLCQPVARQIREKVVLDLVAEVSAHEIHRRAAWKFALPSICRRYHCACVSLSTSRLVNFSAPSGKWPQKIIALVHMLRMALP